MRLPAAYRSLPRPSSASESSHPLCGVLLWLFGSGEYHVSTPMHDTEVSNGGPVSFAP